MTDKTQVVTFTPEERAILDGTSTAPVEEAPAETPVESGITEPEKPVVADKPEPEAEEEESDEEVTEVADGTNPDGTPRRRVIAFSAYDKQRHRANKALEKAEAKEQEAAKLREQVAYLSGLAQNAPKPQQQAPQQTEADELLSPAAPDKAKHPEKYLAWLEASDQRAVARMEKQARQQSDHATQHQQINQAVYNHEQAFINGDPDAGIEPHPDFHDALKFLQDRHTAELKEAGHPPHEIAQIMVARAQSVALKALEAGVSPAQRVYNIAKLHGYKKPGPPKETEAEKIARQAKSQEKAGKTISALPGGEAKGGLTAETLANTSPEEFLKLWNKGDAKALMGWKD
jgi:hypothetical protein